MGNIIVQKKFWREFKMCLY